MKLLDKLGKLLFDLGLKLLTRDEKNPNLLRTMRIFVTVDGKQYSLVQKVSHVMSLVGKTHNDLYRRELSNGFNKILNEALPEPKPKRKTKKKASKKAK